MSTSIYTPTANMAAIQAAYSKCPSLEKFVVEFCNEFLNVKADSVLRETVIQLRDDNGLNLAQIGRAHV